MLFQQQTRKFHLHKELGWWRILSEAPLHFINGFFNFINLRLRKFAQLSIIQIFWAKKSFTYVHACSGRVRKWRHRDCNTFHQHALKFSVVFRRRRSSFCPEWVSSGNRKAIFFCRHGTKYIRNVYLKLKEIYELCSSVHERLSEALLAVRMCA